MTSGPWAAGDQLARFDRLSALAMSGADFVSRWSIPVGLVSCASIVWRLLFNGGWPALLMFGLGVAFYAGGVAWVLGWAAYMRGYFARMERRRRRAIAKAASCPVCEGGDAIPTSEAWVCPECKSRYRASA